MTCPCCSQSLCPTPCGCSLPAPTSSSFWYSDIVGSPGDGGTFVYKTFTIGNADPRSEFTYHPIYFGGIGAIAPDWTWKADATQKLSGCPWQYAKWAIAIDCGGSGFYRRIKWGIVIPDCQTQAMRDISDEVVNKLPGNPWGLPIPGGWGPYVQPFESDCTRPIADIENIEFWNPPVACAP
jgi:hypothetical protein